MRSYLKLIKQDILSGENDTIERRRLFNSLLNEYRVKGGMKKRKQPSGEGSGEGSSSRKKRKTEVAPIHTLNGHTDQVFSVAFNDDGTKVVSGSEDKTIKVWNVATGEMEQTLNGHTATVCSVAFNDDGTKVVSGSEDNTIKVWNVATGEMEQTLNGHTDQVFSVAFNDGTKVVSGSLDNTIKVWNVAKGEMEQTLNGHTYGVMSVAFNDDGTKVVSGSNDKTIKIWNVSTGEMEQTLNHTGSVMSVAFNHDGTKLVSGSWDNTIKIWDTLSLVFPFMKGYKWCEGIETINRTDDNTIIVEVQKKDHPLMLRITVSKDHYKVERIGSRGKDKLIKGIGQKKCQKINNQEYTSIKEMLDELYTDAFAESYPGGYELSKVEIEKLMDR